MNLSRSEILKYIKNAGIVGGGGAGFPTHIKYDSQAEIVIVNGAECEPLLRVDQQFMDIKAGEIVEGLKLALYVTGAKKGIIALKGKYKNAIASLETVIKNEQNISLHIMGNYYPAGDEQTLVYEVTGRIVPEGGIPIAVGVVVTNIVTLYNVFRSCNGHPVISRPLTVTGEVNTPLTFNAPLGTSIREIVNFAGGPKVDNYVIVRGGPMMGTICHEPDLPVTKIDSGIIVLPSDHYLVKARTLNMKRTLKLAKNCEQCTYCTMLCPRYLIGHNIQPHMIMRIVGYGLFNASSEDLCQAFLCCQCGVCSIVACPIDLQPREVYAAVVKELREKGINNPHKNTELKARSHMKLRHVSAHNLVTRLELNKYDVKSPWTDVEPSPSKVTIPLKQHIGTPAVPVVSAGHVVRKGQMIGVVPEGKTGACVHASIAGTVINVDSKEIIIHK